MNRKLLSLLAALAFSPYLPAQTHDHHDHHGAQKLQLNAGKKWETDAPLRQAMGNINQAMAQALPRIHGKTYGEADYQALAGTVNKEVAYAVENCKLPPKADAMLHKIIADLEQGADAMAGQGDKPRHAGATKVLQALRAYGRYFHHPGWRPAGG